MNKEKSNIEKLADFIMEEGPELLPAFLSLVEMSFNQKKQSFEELEVAVTDVSV